jgi:lipopolysaccharide biosynthesis protein
MGGRNLIVAFYLPAFYVFEENNIFWGEGFTEWDNVKRGSPFYDGHIQPNIPVNTGEFDNPQFLIDQMNLAKANSISAFCIYSYWFSGKRVMTRAFDYLSSMDETPIDFCIAWANENWTRRWDGLEDEILIQQNHDTVNDADFIDDHFPILNHPNYLRINGKIVLLIYRPNLMKDPKRTIDNMRKRARQLGLGELNILMVQIFNERDPRLFGFDAAVQFPPNLKKHLHYTLGAYDDFAGVIYDYSEVMNLCIESEADFVEYQGVMPGWDNTPRRRRNAHIYHGETEEKFRSWMISAWEKMLQNIPEEDDKVLFINAWNEWGEGAHLERGVFDKFDALEVVKRVFDEKFKKFDL